MIKFKKETFLFIAENWKQMIFLMFRTKRFGINNKWWSDFDSMFGISIWKRIWWIITIKPLIENYKKVRFRVTACHFLGDEHKDLFGWKGFK